MKFVDEFRNADIAKGVLEKIQHMVTRPWAIMEICGGQTHAILHYGLDELLPPEVELVHGPGCPVCVTSLELIDKALEIASRPNVIFTSYGDMLRVPGSERDLFSVRASGGQVKIVYSPLDAVKIAQENPDKQVVFFCHRLRDHRSGQCRQCLAGSRPGTQKLFRAGFTGLCTACHARHTFFSAQPCAGLFGCRACLFGDGLLGIPRYRRSLPYSHRSHRV